MAVTAEDQRITARASVPATELVRALNNAILALGKHPEAPVLEAVHITWRAGVLFLTATDRRILLRESLDLSNSDGAGQLLLADRDARKLLTVIGKNPGPVLATLRLAGDQLTVATPTTTSVIDLPLDVDDYPDTDPWFADWTDTPRSFCQVSLDPDHLARLAKLRAEQRGAPLQVQLGDGAHKPLAFRMGSRLAGVLMPVRLST